MDCKTDSVVSLSAVGFEILIYQTCSKLFWRIKEKQDKKYLRGNFCDLLPFKKNRNIKFFSIFKEHAIRRKKDIYLIIMLNFFRAGYRLMPWKPYSAFRLVSIKIRTVTSRVAGGGGGGETEDFRLISIFSSFSKACAWEEGRSRVVMQDAQDQRAHGGRVDTCGRQG
jgi:hypothetical protein